MDSKNSNKAEALVLGFANQKGGVGKSTLTHLTAKTLGSASIGKKVKVVEVDKQGTLSEVREEWAKTHENYKYPYDLVSCTLDELHNHLTEEDGAKYDYIFIDMPGTLDKEGIIGMLTTADILFIPLSPSVYDVNSTVTFINTVYEVQEERRKIDLPFTYFTIINRVKPGTKAGRELMSNLEDAKINLFSTTITDYEAYKEHSYSFDEIIGPKYKPNLEFEKFINEFISSINKFQLVNSVTKIVNK